MLQNQLKQLNENLNLCWFIEKFFVISELLLVGGGCLWDVKFIPILSGFNDTGPGHSLGFLVSFIYSYVYFAGRVNGWCRWPGNWRGICLITLVWITCSEVWTKYLFKEVFFPSCALWICLLSQAQDIL